MKTVLFDFDKTLTRRDTLRPVAHFLAKEFCNRVGLIYVYIALISFRLRLVSEIKMKEVFLSTFVRGRKVNDVSLVVKKFFSRKLEILMNRSVFEALERHRKSGDKVFIVSANFDFLLEPLVELWGIDGVIATRTEKVNDVFTGRIIGYTCRGGEKVKRLKEIFAENDIANMVAFGDIEDEEMLGVVEKGVLVKDGAKF